MDEKLIQAAVSGDREARGTLLCALQDPWWRMCNAMLRNPEAAREAVQETGLRFIRDLSRFRGRSELRTWALGIAINVVREMRRLRPLQALDRGDDTMEPASARPGPDAAPDKAAVSAEDRRNLATLLSQLPERQREAIILRFFEDLSVEQAAAAMGCAAGTVKATVHQAIRALRQGFSRPNSLPGAKPPVSRPHSSRTAI